VVPDDDEGIEVVVAATVRDVDEAGVHLTLTVSAGDQKVLGQSRAVLARG
jgi:hypothetical protein